MLIIESAALEKRCGFLRTCRCRDAHWPTMNWLADIGHLVLVAMHNLLGAARIYNFGLVCAFFNIGSIFVAFMMSPLIFSFPDMNNRCAWVLPLAIFPKSSSDSDRKTRPAISTWIRTCCLS